MGRDYREDFPYRYSARKAYSAVLAAEYPTEISCASVGSALGDSLRHVGHSAQWRLTQEFGDRLPQVIAASLRLYWYSVYKVAISFDTRLNVEPLLGQPPSLFDMCYSNIEFPSRPHAVALTISGTLDRQDENLERLARSVGLDAYPDADVVLNAAGFLFLHVAEATLRDYIVKDGDEIPYALTKRIIHLVSRSQEAFREALCVQIWDARSKGEDVLDIRTDMRKAQAKAGAMARLRNDPKQQEKTLVHDCWRIWQEKPENYGSQAEFARDMLSKCEHLSTTRTIEDWCREWRRAAQAT